MDHDSIYMERENINVELCIENLFLHNIESDVNGNKDRIKCLKFHYSSLNLYFDVIKFIMKNIEHVNSKRLVNFLKNECGICKNCKNKEYAELIDFYLDIIESKQMIEEEYYFYSKTGKEKNNLDTLPMFCFQTNIFLKKFKELFNDNISIVVRLEDSVEDNFCEKKYLEVISKTFENIGLEVIKKENPKQKVRL